MLWRLESAVVPGEKNVPWLPSLGKFAELPLSASAGRAHAPTRRPLYERCALRVGRHRHRGPATRRGGTGDEEARWRLNSTLQFCEFWFFCFGCVFRPVFFNGNDFYPASVPFYPFKKANSSMSFYQRAESAMSKARRGGDARQVTPTRRCRVPTCHLDLGLGQATRPGEPPHQPHAQPPARSSTHEPRPAHFS